MLHSKKWETCVAVKAICVAILGLVLIGLVVPSQSAVSAKPRVFQDGSPEEIQTAKEIALRHLETLLPEYGIEKMEDIHVTSAGVDETSRAHIRVAQTFRGIPVWNALAIVHLNPDGTVDSLTDNLAKNIQVDPNPKLTKTEAIKRAISEFGCGEDCLTSEPKAELCILRRDYLARIAPGTAEPWDRDYLVWRVQLVRLDGTKSAEPLYFIDAHDGKVVWHYDNLLRATPTAAAHSPLSMEEPFHQFSTATNGESLYRGSITTGTPPPDPMRAYVLVFLREDGEHRVHYLEDVFREIGTFNETLGERFVDTDNDNVWGNTPNTHFQKAGVDAHWGAAKTYDYFKFVHGRSGVDGANGPKRFISIDGKTGLLSLVVNFGIASEERNNAFWSCEKHFATFGAGDGLNSTAWVSIDVVAHELTHGITQFTAGLSGAGEPGALNESMSDVFGAMVELFVTGGSSQNAKIWKFGEDFYTPGIPGDAIRYMDDPPLAGHPDHYSQRYTGKDDNGGVHINAGISNKVFYLVSQGGSHRGGTVNGIGTFDAARIWYLALTAKTSAGETIYMHPDTTFAGARVATLQAATRLFGGGSRQYQTVAQAWSLCGVEKDTFKPVT